MAVLQSFFCFCIAILSIDLVSATNNSCSDSWLYIDIHYRLTDGKDNAFSYGLFIGAGTASQNQSLWPSVTANETYLASHEYCGPDSPANCHEPANTHGTFGRDFSTTWHDNPNYMSLDTYRVEGGMDVTFGTDNLNLFTHFFDPSPASKYVVNDHPIAIMSGSVPSTDVFFDSGSVGFGSSSTLMKQLLDNERINRNVLGMYLGTAYPRAGGDQNGSLVLGGYDAGRIEGDMHKYTQDTAPPKGASPLKLHVKQMSLVTQDGSAVALVTDDGFDAHISTSQYSMDLPESIIAELATALKAVPSHGTEQEFKLAQKFNGNLTITLEDGFEITYSADWISNQSNLTPFRAPRSSSNSSAETQPLVFGTAFLHHLYMTIDYEEATFYLSNAKVSDNYVQPQPLCSGNTPQALGTPSLNKFAQTGMIGAIIGGIFAAFGAAWLLFFCLRRRIMKQSTKSEADHLEAGGQKPKKSSLRKASKLGFLQLKRKRANKGVVFGDVKRVSHSESESSSVTDVAIDVKGMKNINFTVKEFELNDLKQGSRVSSTNRPVDSPVSPVTPPLLTISIGNHSREQFPTSNRLENPYARLSMPETPYTVATPGTANPLLQTFQRQYSNYDDADDSDLYPQKSQNKQYLKKSHIRTTSDMMRNKLGLSVSTCADSPSVQTVNHTQPEVVRPRPKPATLPIKVINMPPTPTEESAANMSPISMRSTHSKRHSLLRKVFPAS